MGRFSHLPPSKSTPESYHLYTFFSKCYHIGRSDGDGRDCDGGSCDPTALPRLFLPPPTGPLPTHSLVEERGGYPLYHSGSHGAAESSEEKREGDSEKSSD